MSGRSVATYNDPEFLNITSVSPLMSKCNIKVLYLGGNRNGSFITKEKAMSMAETLRGCPIAGHYIENKEMIMHPSFTKGSKKKDWYYGYMAKNTYWFSCWGDLSYSQEDYKNKNVVRNNYICLIPSKFTPFRVDND